MEVLINTNFEMEKDYLVFQLQLSSQKYHLLCIKGTISPNFVPTSELWNLPFEERKEFDVPKSCRYKIDILHQLPKVVNQLHLVFKMLLMGDGGTLHSLVY